MFRFKDDKGFSLIELMVVLAIMSGVAVMYSMSEAQKFRVESQKRASASLDEFTSRIKTKLKDSEICHDNLYKAFKNVNVATPGSSDEFGPYAVGLSTHVKVRDKWYLDSPTSTVPKYDVIVEPDMEWDNGKVFVEDMQYRIYEIADYSHGDLPFNKRGKMRLVLDLARCQKGSAVYRMTDGVKTSVCAGDDIKKSRKTIEMVVAFKQSGTGTIELVNGKWFNPTTKKWEDSTDAADQVPELQCAESEEGLLAGAKKYTDKRICDVQIEMMLATGRPGTNDCGTQIVKRKRYTIRTSGSGSHNLQSSEPVMVNGKIRSQVNKNSFTGIVVGGGGGGGSGCDGMCMGNKAGDGGKAGEMKVINLPSSIAGSSCNFASGGAGTGKKDGWGNKGGESILTCNGFQTVASGGDGGKEKKYGNCDDAGRNGGSITIDGVLSPGGDKQGCNDKGTDGVRGSGGAGAGKGEEYGANGGAGVVKITWEELVVVGPSEDANALKADLVYP